MARIQKVLAQHGYGSRRELERLIKAEQVTVNGRLATLGQSLVLPADITLQGQSIHLKAPNSDQMIIYHKPLGEICSRRDPRHSRTVFQRLPHPAHGRWVMVGRLDLNTSGLLLFTTNGDFAERLMHPRYGVEREYLVKVYGHLTVNNLNLLTTGVMLADGPSCFTTCKPLNKLQTGQQNWYRVTLKAGKNRVVRRLFASQGAVVSQLKRIRFGDIHLPKTLAPGMWQLYDPGS